MKVFLRVKEFYADLVFYHVTLKCYVIIDLKTKKLSHNDIDEEVKMNNDNPTIGLVLCAEKNDTVVEYTLGNNNQQIFTSKYQLHLPSISELGAELRREIKELMKQ